jgi:threonine synthase
MIRVCKICLKNEPAPREARCKDCGGGIKAHNDRMISEKKARMIREKMKKYEERLAQRTQKIQDIKNLETEISNLQAQKDALKLLLNETPIESQRNRHGGLGISFDENNPPPPYKP